MLTQRKRKAGMLKALKVRVKPRSPDDASDGGPPGDRSPVGDAICTTVYHTL
jgi:hypothetical protein